MPVRRILTLALFTGMELALSAVESMIPPFLPLPGVKLGLANIITLIALAYVPKKQVFVVILMRLILTGLVTGTLFVPVFWMSCGGGLLSFAVMALLSGRRMFSAVGVSLAGAAAHNTGQLLSAAFLLGNVGLFYYLPWLLLWSIPMGLFTGFSAWSAIRALNQGGIIDKM
jgi:heptaprenyl diphosphate synthase